MKSTRPTKPRRQHRAVGENASGSTGLRTSLLALIAIALVGCSGPSPTEQASLEVNALTDALAEAVMLSYQATRGEVEPDAGTRVVGEARTISLALNEVAASLDPASQTAAYELTEMANETLALIGQTEYELAEKLRLEEFNPAASEFLTALAGSGEHSAPTSAWSSRKAIFALGGIALGAVFVAAVFWSGARPDPVVEAERRRAERSGLQTKPIERTWSEVPPVFAEAEATRPEMPDDHEAGRVVRSIEIPLNRLLMTALFQVKDHGWDMSVVCPELSIVGDPVRLRGAIMTALSTAFRSGARQVGIVVEDLDGEVLLTIGRDAPPAHEEAERLTSQFVEQIAWALDVDGVESSLISDDDVSLISVALGRKVGADEVSEPVA